MLKPSLITASVAVALSACTSVPSSSQSVVNTLADHLDIRYRVKTNHGATDGINCQELGAEWASCNLVNMTIKN